MAVPDPDKNQCRACGFAWFPAGVDRATECPRCGSPEIAYAWTERWPAYAGCGMVSFFFIASVVAAVHFAMMWLSHR